jgi:hypothetical protein
MRTGRMVGARSVAAHIAPRIRDAAAAAGRPAYHRGRARLRDRRDRASCGALVGRAQTHVK